MQSTASTQPIMESQANMFCMAIGQAYLTLANGRQQSKQSNKGKTECCAIPE